MNQEKDTQLFKSGTEKALEHHYKYLVVDPYAVNLIDQGPRIGSSRLSFYSSFIVNAAREIYDSEIADKILLFSDASFGNKAQSTGELMEEYLIKRSVNPINILTLSDPNLNNSVSQIQRLQKVLLMENVRADEILYLTWDYHSKRVKNHLLGYQLKGVTIVSAVDTHRYFEPKFNRQKMDEVLPYEEIEKIEGSKRLISRIDKKGHIPLSLKTVLGGPFTLDNEKGADGKLHFIYKPGRVRSKEVLGL